MLGFNNIHNDSGVLGLTWVCYVDNAAIGKTIPFVGQENNWVFCQHDQLYDGPHVLTVNATVAKGQTFWFDQIQYVPSPHMSFDNATILIDNADIALAFGPGWGPFGDAANGTIIPNSTTSLYFYGAQKFHNT